MPHTILGSRVIICLLFLLTLPSLASPTAAQGIPSSALPSLAATAFPDEPIRVAGSGYTPGGLVFVVLYDRWGSVLQENRWTVATTTVYGMNGSIDPAQGYASGGSIAEDFDLLRETIWGPNGSQDPALGYVPGTIDSAFAPAVFGANGSMDPANGYVAGTGPEDVIAALCSQQLMARAYDADTQAWSNLADIDSGC